METRKSERDKFHGKLWGFTSVWNKNIPVANQTFLFESIKSCGEDKRTLLQLKRSPTKLFWESTEQIWYLRNMQISSRKMTPFSKLETFTWAQSSPRTGQYWWTTVRPQMYSLWSEQSMENLEFIFTLPKKSILVKVCCMITDKIESREKMSKWLICQTKKVLSETLVMLFLLIFCMARDVTSSDRFLAKLTRDVRILFPHEQKGRDRNLITW